MIKSKFLNIALSVGCSLAFLSLSSCDDNRIAIRWLNDDGSVLFQKSYDYGDTPSYEGPTPIKNSDVDHYYSFIGWDKEIHEVTSNIDIIAMYQSYTYDTLLDFRLKDNNAYEVVAVKGIPSDGFFSIPSTYNGVAVSSIFDCAFYGCDKLTSIYLPDSIKNVASNTFANCENLRFINNGSFNNSYCQITFDANGGTFFDGTKTKIKTVLKNRYIVNAPHHPSKYDNKYYSFSYWSLDKQGTQIADLNNYIVTSYAVLYAQYSYSETIAEQKLAPNGEYIKSVTYFGDDWVMNFWNSDLKSTYWDFLRIKNDGFNSVTLVIPWREVQPSINPIQYNDYFFTRLRMVMNCAEQANLYVFLRIGYAWDFYDDLNSYAPQRYLDLMTSSLTLTAWFDYASKIYETVKDYSYYLGGFICWEDFWNNVGIAKSVSNLSRSESLNYSKLMGYQLYIQENYSLSQYSAIAKESFKSFDDICLPSSNKESFAVFYDFYDYYLVNLLTRTQEYFPNLSMENRLDDDLVNTENGSKYYSHKNTYKTEGSSFACTVYGIPMGFENKGDFVHANQAINMTESILRKYDNASYSKPLFIDQFLFYDDTPKFSYNTRIYDNEINKYLENIGYTLHDYSKGYAVWTYKNYRSNMLYNSQFELGSSLWNINDGAFLINESNNWLVYLSNGSICQQIPKTRNHFIESNELTISFNCYSNQHTTVELLCGETYRTIEIDPNKNDYKLVINDTGFENYNLTIACHGSVKIDNIYCYTYVQNGKIYDENWNELETKSGIIKLNSLLTQLDQEDKVDSLYNIGHFENVKSEDNPFGVNGKVIKYAVPVGDEDDYIPPKKALFMMPGSVFVFNKQINQANTTLSFIYDFYYLAKSWGSDGISISVELFSNESYHCDNLIIYPENSQKQYILNIPSYFLSKEVRFEIRCYDGGHNDGTADWLVVTDLNISEN